MVERVARQPVTLVPLDDEELRESAADLDASDVASQNLEDELRQVENLSVSVYKETGGPNAPMSMCFKKPRSDFPLLDDLKLYVQKHFGAGNYRAHFREGSRIKYNIPFSVVNDPTVPREPAPAQAPAAGNNDTVRLLIEELRAMRQEVNLIKAQPAKDPKADFLETVRLVKELLPPPAVAGAGATGLSGVREFLEVKSMVLDDLTAAGIKGGDEGFNWKDLFAQLPTALGALAGIAQARRGQALPAPQPEPAMTLEPPAPELVTPEIPVPTLSPQARAYAQQLEPLRPQLQQLDTAATFKSDPAFMAETVLDMAEKQNPAMLPVLAGIAAPSNREDVLAALSAVIPATVQRREWYVSFLDAVHNQLMPEEGTVQ